MLVAAVALEALLESLGFFLLGKVKPEKSTGAPLYMTGGGALSLTRRRRDLILITSWLYLIRYQVFTSITQ